MLVPMSDNTCKSSLTIGVPEQEIGIPLNLGNWDSREYFGF